MDCASLRRDVIGPASAFGMIRILRSAWNVPIIAIADSFVEPGRGDEALGCGADCALRWPCEIRRLKDEIEAMTTVFYSHTRLEAIGIPEPVINQLRNWDGLGAVAFESFKKNGRVVIGIEVDEASPGRVKLTAMTVTLLVGGRIRKSRRWRAFMTRRAKSSSALPITAGGSARRGCGPGREGISPRRPIRSDCSAIPWGPSRSSAPWRRLDEQRRAALRQ